MLAETDFIPRDGQHIIAEDGGLYSIDFKEVEDSSSSFLRFQASPLDVWKDENCSPQSSAHVMVVGN